MQQRSALARLFAIGWAIFQMASPAVTAIADGRLAAENSAGPATHVEATSTSSCPQAHSPDCALCRYLSGPANALPNAPIGLAIARDAESPGSETTRPHVVALVLPPGRAPPVLNV
jgi:hypothetical protein